MQIYYDSDADQNIAKGMEIVIIGYGSQGHAHANNLKAVSYTHLTLPTKRIV